jgi:hypothetical protein
MIGTTCTSQNMAKFDGGSSMLDEFGCIPRGKSHRRTENRLLLLYCYTAIREIDCTLQTSLYTFMLPPKSLCLYRDERIHGNICRLYHCIVLKVSGSVQTHDMVRVAYLYLDLHQNHTMEQFLVGTMTTY